MIFLIIYILNKASRNLLLLSDEYSNLLLIYPLLIVSTFLKFIVINKKKLIVSKSN